MITNYVRVSLRDFSNEAEGYELVTAATAEDLEKENYTARMTVPAAQMAEGTVNLKYRLQAAIFCTVGLTELWKDSRNTAHGQKARPLK